MAANATVFRAELQISDMDRHYYATHALTLARHPSETNERLMARLVAFALYADERLEFARGAASDDEPDLWLRSRSGEIELWIDVGQPDESRIRKACGRADEVVVLNYHGRSADLWWEKVRPAVARCGNLTVIDVDANTIAELAALTDRGMRLQCMIQDGQAEIYGEGASINLQRTLRMAPAERA